MSSLMQFGGKITREGVHLQAIQVVKDSSLYGRTDQHEFACPQCKRWHPRIFTFIRKPKGMFGCWVVFQYNGEEHVPDLSVPISLERLPRDAKPMSLEESMKTWHS